MMMMMAKTRRLVLWWSSLAALSSNALLSSPRGMTKTTLRRMSTNIPEQYEGEKVNVRFKNTPQGVDTQKKLPAGINMLKAGEMCGYKIPRACRNGLCNTCIVDVLDERNKKRLTVKACSTSLYPVAGGDELVIDLYRMQSNDVTQRSMSRFDEGWEKDFVPDYKKLSGSPRSRAMGKVNPNVIVLSDQELLNDRAQPPWEYSALTFQRSPLQCRPNPPPRHKQQLESDQEDQEDLPPASAA
mmetsp:Transcript_7311/g.22517  ORF Transcript_7311/g.22517 Transcript_7311/m.22517 type:complete len:242 (+) Transcript_7311:42-767(+)